MPAANPPAAPCNRGGWVTGPPAPRAPSHPAPLIRPQFSGQRARYRSWPPRGVARPRSWRTCGPRAPAAAIPNLPWLPQGGAAGKGMRATTLSSPAPRFRLRSRLVGCVRAEVAHGLAHQRGTDAAHHAVSRQPVRRPRLRGPGAVVIDAMAGAPDRVQAVLPRQPTRLVFFMGAMLGDPVRGDHPGHPDRDGAVAAGAARTGVQAGDPTPWPETADRQLPDVALPPEVELPGASRARAPWVLRS
jgi:hypothetical protein